jgi:hypothetical protein
MIYKREREDHWPKALLDDDTLVATLFQSLQLSTRPLSAAPSPLLALLSGIIAELVLDKHGSMRHLLVVGILK